MNNLSENLKKIRKDNNLSQEQLADELGVSRQAISKWESGVAYPEMEKIIQICQKFELNIDDLLNKDIREIKGEQESKNNINKFIDDFLHYITDSVNLFSNMNFKTKIKCIFEQLIIIGILAIILLIIGGICSEVFGTIFRNLLPANIYYKIYGIFSGLFIIFAIIIGVLILVHIFKTRYLNYYKNIKNSLNDDTINNDNTDNTRKEKIDNDISIDSKNKILFRKNEDKIIIRDPKHSEYRFINGIFKILILFVKFFALLFALFLCLLLVCFVTGFVMSFTIIKTGIFFIGLLLSMLSLGVGSIVIILLLFNFIFNRKNDKKKMIWSFIIAIIIFGVSCGLIFIGSLKFNVSKEVNTKLIETRTIELDMQKNLTIINYENIEYIEKSIDNIVIEYDINKKCKLDYDVWDSNNKKVLHYWSYASNPFEIIRTIIDEINEFNIININSDILNIKVYASKENIELLKANKKEYDITIKEQETQNTYYESKIAELQDELEEKLIEINKLQEQINMYEIEDN